MVVLHTVNLPTDSARRQRCDTKRGRCSAYALRMGRNRTTAPVASSRDWPREPCEDADAEFVRLLVESLREAMGEWSIRRTAEAAGMDHGIVTRLLAGKTWPEAVTVARLERGLGVRLWPDHVRGHATACATTAPSGDSVP